MAETTETERKPKTVPMKWLKLGEAKDPNPSDTVLLAAKRSNGEAVYGLGGIRSITFDEGRKVYTFDIGRDNGEVITNDQFTHYCIIKAPTE